MKNGSKAFLGSYDNENNTFTEKEIKFSREDKLNSLSIGAGVRVRAYVNAGAAAIESLLQSTYGELLTTKNGLYLVCQEGSPNL